MSSRKKNYAHFILILMSYFGLFYTQICLAWEHGISLGFGGGQEIEMNYTNTIYVLNAKLYKFPKIDDTLIATLDTSASLLHSDTPEHNSLFALALTPSLRGYFVSPALHTLAPYMEVSSGPAYISHHQLGETQQGSLLVLQTSLGVGMEIVKNHTWDLNFHFVHYCNAGLSPPNQGFDFPLVVSIGYLW